MLILTLNGENNYLNDAMNNDVRNENCSYALCNLSYVGASQLVKRHRCVIFTIYNAVVANWANYSTPITIATGLPWSNTFGFSAVYNYYDDTTNIGKISLSGSNLLVCLKTNVAFNACHIYLV